MDNICGMLSGFHAWQLSYISFLLQAACAEMYGSDSLREYESSFFNCIKKEVFLSGDPAVEEAGLQALTALVKTLSTGIIEVHDVADVRTYK